MTAPVTLHKSGERWRVHFVMPNEYSLAQLPTPDNNAVILREVPEQRYASIVFSGLVSERKTAAKTAELLACLQQQDITALGKPELARYNAPWTLPFLRRNEILVHYE